MQITLKTNQTFEVTIISQEIVTNYVVAVKLWEYVNPELLFTVKEGEDYIQAIVNNVQQALRGLDEKINKALMEIEDQEYAVLEQSKIDNDLARKYILVEWKVIVNITWGHRAVIHEERFPWLQFDDDRGDKVFNTRAEALEYVNEWNIERSLPLTV